MQDSDRIGRLEGAVSGLRHSQNLALGAIAVVSAVLIALGIYTLQRVDSLDEKVSRLPNEIAGQLRDITSTLADAITAAKQAPPQVILVPAPEQAKPDEARKP